MTNHLLGRRSYSAANFDAIADGLREDLAGLVSGEPLGEEGFRDAGGNYDIQVMDVALSRAGLREQPNSTSVLRIWSGNEHALQDGVRSGDVGAVVVHRATRVAGQVVGGHFYCLKFHPPTDQWWNLDSIPGPGASGPQMLSAQGVVSHLQRESRDHSPPTGAILLYSVPAMDPGSPPGGGPAPAQPPGHPPGPPEDPRPEGRPGCG